MRFGSRVAWTAAAAMMLVGGGCGKSATSEQEAVADVSDISAASQPSRPMPSVETPVARPATASAPNRIAPSRVAANRMPANRMAAILARGDDLHPIIILHTSMGDLILRLDAEKAPRTVYNFISYAASGHYNDTIFHQVEPGYAVLGGAYTAELEEKPARYPIRNESSAGMKNRRGTVAMAHQPGNADSATCQFIINLADNANLDYQGDDAQRRGYCVFGEVIEGLQVLEAIGQVKVHSVKQFPSIPVQAVTIKAVTRVR